MYSINSKSCTNRKRSHCPRKSIVVAHGRHGQPEELQSRPLLYKLYHFGSDVELVTRHVEVHQVRQALVVLQKLDEAATRAGVSPRVFQVVPVVGDVQVEQPVQLGDDGEEDVERRLSDVVKAEEGQLTLGHVSQRSNVVDVGGREVEVHQMFEVLGN